jgi:hypothetical protein
MNRFSLNSDSRAWWLPAGAAGCAATGLLAASLALVPTGGAGAETWSPGDVQRGYAHIPGPTPVPDIQRNYAHIPGPTPVPDIQRNYAHIPGPTSTDCPPPPDPRYVAGPWVAPDSECDTLRHWWRYVR